MEAQTIINPVSVGPSSLISSPSMSKLKSDCSSDSDSDSESSSPSEDLFLKTFLNSKIKTKVKPRIPEASTALKTEHEITLRHQSTDTESLINIAKLYEDENLKRGMELSDIKPTVDSAQTVELFDILLKLETDKQLEKELTTYKNNFVYNGADYFNGAT
jgi:hypothetical protein